MASFELIFDSFFTYLSSEASQEKPTALPTYFLS